MGTLDTAKPFYRLEVIEPEGSQPKYVLSPNVFLDTEKPSDASAASADIYLTSLNVTSRLHSDINICELTIQHGLGNAPPIKIDSTVKVYLGYYYKDQAEGAEYSLVFTGTVYRVQTHMQKTLLECRSSLYKLIPERKKIAFSTMMTIDEIINKLAITEGGMELASDGIQASDIKKQPGFSISEQMSLLDHVKLFAEYSGLYVYMDVNDKFHAGGWLPGDLTARSSDEEKEWINARNKTESSSSALYKHELTFGRDIIECDFEITIGKYSSVELIGFMSFGEEQVHTIDPPKVEYVPTDGADPDLPKKVFKLSHVTREDAEKIAENLYNRLSVNLVGKLKVLGSPQIRLGDGIMVKGEVYEVPPFRNVDFSSCSGSGDDLDSKVFQIIKVNHRFNNAEGYVTLLDMIDIAATSVPAPGEGEGAEGTGLGIGEGEETEFGGAAGETAEEKEEQELAWIEIELVGEDNVGVANAKYKLILPDDSVVEGNLDENGFARIGDIKVEGECRVSFPDIDMDAWEIIETG